MGESARQDAISRLCVKSTNPFNADRCWATPRHLVSTALTDYKCFHQQGTRQHYRYAIAMRKGGYPTCLPAAACPIGIRNVSRGRMCRANLQAKVASRNITSAGSSCAGDFAPYPLGQCVGDPSHRPMPSATHCAPPALTHTLCPSVLSYRTCGVDGRPAAPTFRHALRQWWCSAVDVPLEKSIGDIADGVTHGPSSGNGCREVDAAPQT